MSKHKNKENKATTPKEPITRRDLCERICTLQQEVDTLRHINTSLTQSADFYRITSQKAIKLSEESLDKLERMEKCVHHYRRSANIAIIALILSWLFHLIYLFI